MKKRIEELKIIDRQELQSNYIFWELQSENAFEYICPGQFINIRVKDSETTFVRRPFSIHHIDYEKRSIQFMMKVVGDGTRALSKLEPGAYMDVVFPLGKGFSLEHSKEALLVGGGYGIAPLYHVAEELIAKGKKVRFLFGARTESDFILLDKFEALAPLHITTEDGTLGTKGRVTDHAVWDDFASKTGKIYSCGPEPMMHAVAKIAEAQNVDCEVSLDQVMGCGIGVCLACVKETVRGNEATCLHGPVYNSKEIRW